MAFHPLDSFSPEACWNLYIGAAGTDRLFALALYRTVGAATADASTPYQRASNQPLGEALSAQIGKRRYSMAKRLKSRPRRSPSSGRSWSRASQTPGRIPPDWKAKPAKLRHKDRDARWTVKFSKAKPRADGSMPPVDLAIPLFGYQNHVSIDRRFGFIRRWAATDAAAYEGRRLRQGLLDKNNTASGMWADTAYRSAANETFLTKNGFVSHIHRKKPKGRAMPETMQRVNNAKSKIRARVEHVFAEQKDRMRLFIRTIGIARATTKVGMANLVYNIKRFIFQRKIAIA